MKKTVIASAVALGMGTAGSASALTVQITSMNFNGLYGVTGSISSNGTGSFTSLTPFFGVHWTADAVAFFSNTTTTNTWAGAGGGNTNDSVANGSFSYTFNLTANQVAWGTLFDWNMNNDIPVLNIMTCTGFTPSSACAGTGTPMQTPPFSGAAPVFNGHVVSASTGAVPIPAAAWLMGSGLVGLAGVARRRKKS